MQKLFLIALLLFVTLNSFGQRYFKITEVMSDQYSWNTASGYFTIDGDVVKVKTPHGNLTIITDSKTYKNTIGSNGLEMSIWEAEVFNEKGGDECMFSMIFYENTDVSILIYLNDDDFIAFYGKRL